MTEGPAIQAIIGDEKLSVHLKLNINPWLGVPIKIWNKIMKKYNFTEHCWFLRWITYATDFPPDKSDIRFKLWEMSTGCIGRL